MDKKHPIYDYLAKRLDECGIDQKKNEREVLYSGIDDVSIRKIKVPIVRACEQEDAIEIVYTDIDGNLIDCTEADPDGKNEQVKERSFSRLRYREAKEYTNPQGVKKQMRYSQPAGTPVYPYFPPQIVDLNNRKRSQKKGRPITVETLYVVEGEFKALAACYKLGLPFVGIGGIHNFKAETGNMLSGGLRDAIRFLRPRNVVLFFDADCLEVKYHKDKNLDERLNTFYRAVTTFREMIKEFSVDFYFGHIQQKYGQVAKGLDDLINLPDAKRDELRDELEKLSVGKKQYTSIMFVDPAQNRRLLSYFNLNSVSSFYDAYSAEIGERPFRYKNRTYFYDGEKLSPYVQSIIDRYIMVDGGFYKAKDVDMDYEQGEPTVIEYVPTKRLRVLMDLNGDTKAMYKIPRYDFFSNKPDNTDSYQRVYTIGNSTYFNRYQRITHQPIPGRWDNIEKLLRHVFNQDNALGDPMYEFGLDYLKLLYLNPTYKLPVLVLASREKNTGKTSFLNFIKDVFQQNVTIQGNKAFASDFTTLYADKLVLAIDEDIEGLDKREMQSFIKALTTANEVRLEAKHENASMIKSYLHLMMTTNLEENFMQISDDENRYAVVRVPPLQGDDPNILAKCKREIPYFLYYLTHREMKYPKRQGRFFFEPKAYETESLLRVRERSASRLKQEFLTDMTEYFRTYNLKECELSPIDIINRLAVSCRLKPSKSEIINFLRVEMGKEPTKSVKRYKLYDMGFDSVSGGDVQRVHSKTGLPYLFKREEIIKEEEEKQQ